MPPHSPVLASRDCVLDALHSARWVITDAARRLGVTRQGLYKAIRRLGIEVEPAPREVMSRILSEAGSRGGRPRKNAAA